jgi:hypothetical protein
MCFLPHTKIHTYTIQSSTDGRIPNILITVNTNILSMEAIVRIPPRVTAIPYVRFMTCTLNVVKQNRTFSLAIVSTLFCRIRSNKAQLTTDNRSSLCIIPVRIATDSTPAKRWMIYFDPSCVVISMIHQSDLQVRES